MLRSKISSCTWVACSRCSRLSGRWGASRKAISRAYSPFVNATEDPWGSVTPSAPIDLPATELAPAALRIPLRRGAAGLLPSQYGADARQKLPKTERLGDVVVGAQFQPDHPIDLVASTTGGDDYRNIGARPDVAQQVKPVLLTEPQIEDHEIRLSCGEMMDHLLPPRCGDGAYIVFFQVVADHAQHDRIVVDDDYSRRLIFGHAHVQVRLAKCWASVSAASVEKPRNTSVVGASLRHGLIEASRQARQTFFQHHSITFMWPADGTRADGAAPFAALDPANHRSIASPKSAQLWLTARARTPTRAKPAGPRENKKGDGVGDGPVSRITARPVRPQLS